MAHRSGAPRDCVQEIVLFLDSDSLAVVVVFGIVAESFVNLLEAPGLVEVETRGRDASPTRRAPRTWGLFWELFKE